MMDRNYYIGLCIILLAPIMLSIVAFNLDTTPRNTTELVDNVRPGIVLISKQIDTTTGGTGTGFFIKDNLIVTNHHVVDANEKLFVYSSNSYRSYEAEIVNLDLISDIATIRLKDWELFKKNEMPTNLTLGNSNKMRQGDKVIVIGHPWGLSWTVSEGILSAKNRRPNANPKFMDQVDANIFQGNSGGPIFNEDGQVICVSASMLVREGGSYGFCIPSDLVSKVLHDFDTVKEVRWRVINVTVGLTEDGSSVILKNVEPGGAAGMAGLKENDKVLEIYTPNNHPKGVKVRSADEIITEMAVMNGNDETIKLLIDRNGEKIMFSVKSNYKLSKEYTPDKVE